MGEGIFWIGVIAAIGWGWGLLHGIVRGHAVWRRVYWVVTVIAILVTLIFSVLGTTM